MMKQFDTHFATAQTEWDLDRLYRDLASAKGKSLSPMEKLHLRGLLCGLSPMKIAKALRKNAKGVYVDLAKTLYPYMAKIAGKPDEGIGNWRNVRLLAEKAGYKKTQSSPINQPSNMVTSQPSNTGTVINILTSTIVEIHAKTICVGEGEYIDINLRLGPFPVTDSLKKK